MAVLEIGDYDAGMDMLLGRVPSSDRGHVVFVLHGWRCSHGRSWLCCAEGKDGRWQAICLDLDIAAVQGSSFEEVFHSLNDAVALYLETVADLPAEDRERLRHRTIERADG